MVKDKIAILGATGFIGMHLCKKLVDEEGIINILITLDSNDKPKSIIAYGIKKNFLFNSYRNYKLSFDSIGNLTNYLFEDKQIRIFNDTLLYKVSGNVIW